MADNFNMKQYLVENKLGAYSRLKEDLGKDIEDTQAEKDMDFLAEYEVIYVVRDGKCYRKDDEGNMDEVPYSYCKRYAEGKEEKEEGYMGTQYDSSEDMAVDMVKKGLPEEKVEEAGQGTLMAIDRIEEIVSNLARNIATNSNIPTQEKIGLVQALKELKDLVEDLGADVEQEDEYVSDYSRRRASELNEGLSPEYIDRMEGLANIQDLADFKAKLKSLASDWMKEGFEKEDVVEYVDHILNSSVNETKEPVEEDKYDIDAKSFGGALKSDNPEGDALVLRFLKGIAKKFDYPVGQAALFVKERLKKLGY